MDSVDVGNGRDGVGDEEAVVGADDDTDGDASQGVAGRTRSVIQFSRVGGYVEWRYVIIYSGLLLSSLSR
jgi:hypothetical protein